MTVVVVGSVNVDLTASGGRLPAPGETVTMAAYAELPGGKGGNQASAAAALAARVRFVGAVGRDARGADARADLADRGVDVTALASVDAPTGVAIILVDDAGENVIAVVPGANAAVAPDAVRAALGGGDGTGGGSGTPVDGDAAGGERTVVVTCLEIPMESVRAAAAEARRHGWPLVLNPAPAPEGGLPADAIEGAVLTPNQTEVELLGGADALLAAGAAAVVVTRGGDGVDLHLPGGAHEHVDALPAEVVDTTGAGDAFTAGLAVALDDGFELRDAVRFAAAAGAIATEGRGARGSTPTRVAVEARLARRGSAPSA